MTDTDQILTDKRFIAARAPVTMLKRPGGVASGQKPVNALSEGDLMSKRHGPKRLTRYDGSAGSELRYLNA